MLEIKVVSNLKTVINKVTNMHFKPPLKESIDLMKFQTEANITNQGFEFGSFKKLSDATKKARSRKESLGIKTARRDLGSKKGGATGSFKILVDTGKGLKSFKTKATKQRAELTNTTSYMGYHQTGTRRMPKRTIYGFNEKTKNAITQVFYNYIKKILGV